MSRPSGTKSISSYNVDNRGRPRTRDAAPGPKGPVKATVHYDANTSISTNGDLSSSTSTSQHGSASSTRRKPSPRPSSRNRTESRAEYEFSEYGDSNSTNSTYQHPGSARSSRRNPSPRPSSKNRTASRAEYESSEYGRFTTTELFSEVRRLDGENKELVSEVRRLHVENKELQRKNEKLSEERDVAMATLQSLQENNYVRRSSTGIYSNDLNPTGEISIASITSKLHECISHMNVVSMKHQQELNDSAEKTEKHLQKRYEQRFSEMDNKTKEIDLLKSYLSDSRYKVHDLSSRLASEMGNKVAANESSIENVSIRIRPTIVAEKYGNLCNEEWLDAKNSLDKKRGILYEEDKLEFLCGILMIAEERAVEKHKDLKLDIENRLLYPLALKPDTIRGTEDIVQPKRAQTASARARSLPRRPKKLSQPDAMPQNVANTIGDFLRITSQDADIAPLISEIKEHLQRADFKKVLDKLDKEISPSIQKYIAAAADITWKMVNQRPQMKFQMEKKGTRFVEKTQEIYWNSDDPSYATLLCYAYPSLYHDKALMVKGRVLLKSTHRKTIS